MWDVGDCLHVAGSTGSTRFRGAKLEGLASVTIRSLAAHVLADPDQG